MVYNPNYQNLMGDNVMSITSSPMTPMPTAQVPVAAQSGAAEPDPTQQEYIDATTGMPAPYLPAADTYGYLDPRQAAGFGRFFTSPDYQFRLNEGLRAMDQSAAGRGMLLSGKQLRDINQYGQNLAAGEYGNYMNRMFSVAGLGRPASNAPYAQMGAGAYNQMIGAAGQLGTNLANIRGARGQAQQNAWGGALGNIDFGGLAKGISGWF